MPLTLLTGPAVEPIGLAEAKHYLRVEHSDDDALISTLVTAARAEVETRTHRALITQTWRLTRDAWPAEGRFVLARAPLQAVLAARVFDAGGVAQMLDTDAFTPDGASAVLGVAAWLPPPGRAVAGIEIDLAFGYGETADTVPAPLQQAIRLLLAHHYEHRGVSDERPAAATTVAALLAPYRVMPR